MHKLIALLVALLIIAALVIGAGLTGISEKQRAPIVAALAEQEQAKAAKLRAEASIAEQAAAQAELDTEAKQQALPALAAAWRWWALTAAAAGAVAMLGAALAGVHWLQLRARVIYPDAAGHWPIVVDRRWGGAIAVLDTSRNLAPALLLDEGGQARPSIEAPAVLHLQAATHAAASATIAAVAGKAQGEDVVKRIGEVSGRLPVPTFDHVATDPLRMVYVKQPGGANSEAARDLADLRDFITGAGVRGLARRAWLGHHFASGHECTRTRYDDLVRKCERASVLDHDGQSWRLAVSEIEALDAFGLGEKDLAMDPDPEEE